MADNNARAYEFEYFETGFSAAPQRKPEERTKPEIKKVAPATREDLFRQEMRGMKNAIGVFSFILVMFAIISMQIVAGAKNYSLDREIQKAEAELVILEAESVRLSSALNGITGISAIDTYATEVLGMTRVENYQIECIDLSPGDSVLYTTSLF